MIMLLSHAKLHLLGTAQKGGRLARELKVALPCIHSGASWRPLALSATISKSVHTAGRAPWEFPEIQSFGN
jgi:hypothetical protein